jgi:hypothetical protein
VAASVVEPFPKVRRIVSTGDRRGDPGDQRVEILLERHAVRLGL